MADLIAVDRVARARMEPIIQAVLRLYDMSLEDLTSEGKKRGPVEARGACCWLARKLNVDVTLTEIAATLGIASHGAVRQGFERIEKLRGRDKWLRDSTDALLAELGAA